jgi:hypothetical protein
LQYPPVAAEAEIALQYEVNIGSWIMLPVCGESNQTTNCITPMVEA